MKYNIKIKIAINMWNFYNKNLREIYKYYTKFILIFSLIKKYNSNRIQYFYQYRFNSCLPFKINLFITSTLNLLKGFYFE